MQGFHEPVLLKEILERVEIEKGETYIDCTLGDGGYSLEILKRGGRIIGIDVDPKAIERARERFLEEGINGSQFELIQGNFSELDNLVKAEMQGRVKAILFDLGVSTLALKTPDRGFSFLAEGPLDMRMDPNLTVTAADLINAGERQELNELFSKYGEERLSFRFAKAIVSQREIKINEKGIGITTTKELAEILEKAAGKRGRIHPATRVFQALRIAVNDELRVLETALPKALNIVSGGGFIAVVSFHSLEDRIVKNNFKDYEKQGFGKNITKKPVTPSEVEIQSNPASRSGRLRIFQKK